MGGAVERAQVEPPPVRRGGGVGEAEQVAQLGAALQQSFRRGAAAVVPHESAPPAREEGGAYRTTHGAEPTLDSTTLEVW